MKNEYIIPIYLENINNDVFCSKAGKKQITKDEIKNKIDLFLKDVNTDDIHKEVAFFGCNFSELKEDDQENLLKFVYEEYIENGKIDSIRISTIPNSINKDILKMLKKYKVKTIELAVLTSNNYILNKCKLKFSIEDVKKSAKLVRRHGFNLGFQIMIGLPESTRLDELNTARDFSKLKPKIIRICPLVVLKETDLEKRYSNQEYTELTLNQTIERSKELYYFFNKKKISQIHIGFINSDLTKSKASEVIVGPYNENFDILVEDSIWYDSIVERIKKFNVKVKEVEITVNPKNKINVIGLESENVDKLKEFYDVDIVLTEDEEKAIGKFDMKILKTYTDFLDENKE